MKLLTTLAEVRAACRAARRRYRTNPTPVLRRRWIDALIQRAVRNGKHERALKLNRAWLDV